MQESFLKIKRDFVLPLRKFDSFTSCRFTYWIDPISYTSLFSARNRSLTCFFFPFNYEVRQIYFLPALNREKTSYQLTQHSNYITVTELELFQAEGWGTSGLPIYRPGCACSAWRHPSALEWASPCTDSLGFFPMKSQYFCSARDTESFLLRWATWHTVALFPKQRFAAIARRSQFLQTRIIISAVFFHLTPR